MFIFILYLHPINGVQFIFWIFWDNQFVFSIYRIMALRKAEKEEEKRAREKIRQRLEEDKVRN